MRIPYGPLERLRPLLPEITPTVVIGCLGAEERSIAVPLSLGRVQTHLLAIRDPPLAFPDFTALSSQRMASNLERLKKAGLEPQVREVDLLCSDDDILEVTRALPSDGLVILDITSLPKRFFCLILRRLLTTHPIPNVLVTYTRAGVQGYNDGPLMSDFKDWDFLPGYGGRLFEGKATLVLGVGFEPIDIPKLIESYGEENLKLRVVLSFPADPTGVQREWSALRKILRNADPAAMEKRIVAIAPQDPEAVYLQLDAWRASGERLAMAPFGPKPHTLGMALFSMQHNCNMFYTQPKSYNPDYTRGTGEVWGYLVKWKQIPCFDRNLRSL